MNIAVTMRMSQCFAVQLGFVIRCSMKDNFGTHALHCGYLTGIGIFRDDDNGLDSEESRSVCDGLPMIAGRSGNHASFAFLRAELRNQVDAPTHFEGPYRLVIFMFDKHFGAK